jgi:hypothetical protein
VKEASMKEVSDFISSVGFPIVVCLLMIYQQEKISVSYIEIVNSLKELISDNTKSINLLIGQSKETQNENKQETSQTISNNK